MTEVKCEAAYLRRAEHNRQVDEVRHDKTKQRQFELAFAHYDWEEDFEQHRIFEVDNSGLALMGRRDFSLRSPSEQAQFNLDFEYYEELLARTGSWLLIVFRAVFYGFSWQDIDLPKRSWWNYFEKIENILAREA